MNNDTIEEWTNVNFKPIIGLSHRCLTLVKGWMFWIFKSMGEANKILQNWCKWGSQTLFLK
jgi:hypothetical protein